MSPCLRGEERFALRLGLRYAKGLREEAAQALVRERMRAPFASISDLARRVPELRKKELVLLGEIGALNAVSSLQSPVSKNGDAASCVSTGLHTHTSSVPGIGILRYARDDKSFHRRDALWQVERAGRSAGGPLLRDIPEADTPSPLEPMTSEERLVADFRGTGLTVGPHPMAYRREQMNAMGVRRASELARIPHGTRVRAGGCVIARQRPGTAKGFVFLSLEDESGIANAIVTPDLFDRHRVLLVSEKFLLVEGRLEKQDNVISVKAERIAPLRVTAAETRSHDFH